jgi:predicted small metal-binding protein
MRTTLTDAMVKTTCKGCGIEFVAPDEEDLVTQVQAHVAAVHAHGHTPTREQVLAVIRKRSAGTETDRSH